MKRYYFIDDEIYFKNVKQPPRKVELFFVDKVGSLYLGKDEDGNDYVIGEEDMIIEENNMKDFIETIIIILIVFGISIIGLWYLAYRYNLLIGG